MFALGKTRRKLLSYSIACMRIRRSCPAHRAMHVPTLADSVHNCDRQIANPRVCQAPAQIQHRRGCAHFAARRRARSASRVRDAACTRLDQRRDVLRRRRGHDAVAQVEDVARRRPGRAHDGRAPRARRWPGPSAAPAGRGCPAARRASPTRARAAREVDRPVEADARRAACRRCRRATAPPPLVNTIVGIGAVGRRSAASTVAHRRQRKARDRRRRSAARPRCRTASRASAPRVDLLAQIGGDRARVDVDEPLQQIGPRIRHPAHARRNRALPPPSIM